MPILLLEHQNATRGTPLPPRLLIGRRSMNHLVIDDPAVSRMHAWIDVGPGGRAILTDMRSRTGTRVNGTRLGFKSQALNPGDVIEIGPARLTLLTGEAVPAGVEPLDLPREPAVSPRDVGIRFDCPHCRAPMWAAATFAGCGGICTYCSDGFTIPRLAPVAALSPSLPPPTPPPPAADPRSAVARPANRPGPAAVQPLLCGVCQSAIYDDEEQATCPSCGLRFHADCWHENYGCSAYGCPQVNALAPPEPDPEPLPGPAATGTDDPIIWALSGKGGPGGRGRQAAGTDPSKLAEAAKPRTPWEFILLGASAVAVVLSAASFGAASLATLVWAIVYLLRKRNHPARRTGVLAGAVALSVVGLVAGAAVSYFLFVNGRR